ncbi:MAG: FlgD immunoglobulin-like domain containing protein, partial [Candidatus Marinimicrobia bacterium]|nr:FlgD immunoglobulin-like domain containing protein [Candidatus Neomarinimicrobiota bacterium]
KRHISDDLRIIARYGHSLPEEMKNELRSLGFNFDGPIVNRSSLDERTEASGLDQTYDNGKFRYHYTTTGSNAVDDTDDDSNGIPDYIDQMAETFEYVEDIELTTNGFVEPPSDDWYSANNDNGGSGAYDVYVRNAGGGVYGYVQPEYYANNNTGNNEHSSGVNEVNAFTSYMVMRHNYNGFPNTELEAIQVTAAHEYFHAVQFGYDGWEESWVMQATAVQMEEIVYDNINDCYQYMSSWFNNPQQSLNLDSSSRGYGSFIFFEYVNSHLSEESIRTFWEQSITHDSYYGDYSIQTLDEAFDDLGSSFEDMLNGMSVANQVMSSASAASPYNYDEADSYSASLSTFNTVSYSAGTDQTVSSTNLQENAAQYIRLNSADPVLATLTNDDGPDSYLELHAIMSYEDNAWTVRSGSPINVDPTDATEVYFVVVSQNDAGSDFDYTLTLIDGEISTEPEIPSRFSVSNAYPNPFNPQTNIQIDLQNPQRVQVYIYDIKGQMVKTLVNRHLVAGQHVFTWKGKNYQGHSVSTGTYFVRIIGKSQERWQKVTLLK